MSDSEILRRIQTELGNAEPFDAETPRRYFDAELPPPPQTVPGEPPWPAYVSPEVRNSVLAVMAEVLPGFVGDQPLEFPPTSAEDEEQARSETEIVGYCLWTLCRGYEPVMRAIQASLTYGWGALEVSWDSSRRVSGRRMEGLREDQFALMLMQQDVSGAEQGEDGSFAVDVRQVERTDKPLVEWVAPEELIVAKGHTQVDMDDVRFIARRKLYSRSDLVAWGVPREQAAEIPKGIDSATPDGVEWASEEVMVCVSYLLYDADDDGIAERRRVITAGGIDGDQVVLDNRPVSTQPFAIGIPQFGMDSWRGISLHERLKGLQDTKSELVRQMLETGWRNLLQRTWGVENTYSQDDMLASRRGGHVRVKSPTAIGLLPDVQVSPVSLSLLQQLDTLRRESGGGAVDASIQMQQVGGDTAHGIERVASAMEQGNTLLARNLAETLMRTLYLKLHALLRENWQGELVARLGQQWVTAVPQQWQPRQDVQVSVGLSTADRTAYAGALVKVIEQQVQAISGGMDGVLVGLPQVHAALIDFARMMGLPAPEQYWVDPASEEAQQAQQAKQQAKQQAEEEQKQQVAAAAKAQVDLTLQVEQIKAAVQKYETDWDHQKAVNDQLLKMLELAAKYTAQDVSDVEAFNPSAAKEEQPSA